MSRSSTNMDSAQGSTGTTTTQASAPSSEPPARGRGRGRGKRGGRGRGQPPAQRQQGALTSTPGFPQTLAERAAQISASSATPIPPLPIAPMPLDQLSDLMEAHFSSEMEPQEYVQDVLIDVNGYVDLAHCVYNNIAKQKEEYQKLFCEAEFVLCCGWLLAHRVLFVRNAITPVEITGFIELREAMQSLPRVPEPIAQYLEGLGLYRDTQGQTLCPSIVWATATDEEQGLHPSTIADLENEDLSLIGSMFPFGLYERTLLSQNGTNTYPHALNQLAANFQVPPQNPPARNEYFTRMNKMAYVPPKTPHASRRPHLITEYNTQGGLSLQRMIRWNADLFTEFCQFCSRIQKHMSCVPLPKSTAGSPAMTSAAVPDGDGQRRFDSFNYQAYLALNKSEQHASRLFRYRVKRPGPHAFPDPQEQNYDAAYEQAPYQFRGPAPLSITEVRSMKIYLQFYVSKFIKES